MQKTRSQWRQLLASLALLAASGESAVAEEFYEGKVLSIVVGSAAGSVYDLYGRTVGQFLPKYIPGHPTVIVQDKAGAGGVIAAGYMASVAPRDGSMIGLAVSSVPTAPLLHPEMAKYDPTKFPWIGNITSDAFVAYVTKSAPVQTYEAMKSTPVIMGGVATGTASVDYAVVSNALFGTKMQIVTGYDDQTAIKLAVERGELHGTFGGGYSSLSQSGWLKSDNVKIILQHGFERLPDLPDVPLFIDQAKTADERQMVELLLSPQLFNKPLHAPPDVPADRVDILRRAFDRVMKDPEFLAVAAKSNLTVLNPMSGEELSAKFAKITATPQVLVDRLKGILASFAKK
jgi:tripartite-type tricarboxylate transporter receptor subunit TctC